MRTYLLIPAIAVALIACGGDSGNNNNIAEPPSDSVSNLAGLYYTDADGDEYYQLISDDGFFTIYDFEGDAVDMGQNCYRLYENYSLITHTEGDTYSYEILNEEILDEIGAEAVTLSIEIFKSGNRLEIPYLEESFTVSDTPISDLAPLCDASDNGNENNIVEPPSDPVSSLSGLYYTNTDGDEYYQLISDDGFFTVYNFEGDAVDMGKNCYRAYENHSVITHVEGDTYSYEITNEEILDKLGEDAVTLNIEVFKSENGLEIPALEESLTASNGRLSDFAPLCEDSDNDNNIVEPPSDPVSSLAGLYYTDADGDAYYELISDDGLFTRYDFAGDALDMGPNCYVVVENYAAINHVEDDTFSYEIIYEEVLDELGEDELVIDIDIFKSGSNLEMPGLNESLTATGILISDIAPLCNDSFFEDMLTRSFTLHHPYPSVVLSQ